MMSTMSAPLAKQESISDISPEVRLKSVQNLMCCSLCLCFLFLVNICKLPDHMTTILLLVFRTVRVDSLNLGSLTDSPIWTHIFHFNKSLWMQASSLTVRASPVCKGG